ncbi:DEKNAAC104589 [Brettanomyces naardenensis]|uniref:Defective in cullin neddylation protein n=1 Tax=Brettanomyces naardenensis TaxID=13370 RepID=A0A448YR93_BRENA|nr:DEKNAAC104589 [Brettanomyces naardenensis]
MAPRSASVRKFLEVTGIESEDIASFFLKRNNGRITESINDYFSNPRIVKEIERRAKQENQRALVNVSTELRELFNKYKEEQPDPTGKPFIGIDGTLRYLSDLGYEPEDEVVLCLAELLDSQSVGQFKEDPFLKNWTKVGCNSINEMRDFIEESLKARMVNDPEYFLKIYQYTYRFILEKNEKNLPLDMAEDYWHLLIPKQYSKELDIFLKFMHENSKNKVTRDQWNMLLPFLEDFHEDSSLQKYDENKSWPLLMDEFYEYINGDRA